MANEKRLISADALKEHLKSYTGMFTDEIGFAVSLEAVLWGIDAAPKVDAVEVVHGRWLSESVEFTYEKDIKCSVCGRYVDEPENYCPNCGAKMDGERKDNERTAD